MSRSEKVPGRNLSFRIENFTVARKADQYFDAPRPIESIGFCRFQLKRRLNTDEFPSESTI
jgi:hypothetical protein